MGINEIISYVFLVISAAAVTAASLPLIHILQLESYQGRMYFKWVAKHKGELATYFIMGAASLAVKCCYVFFYSDAPALATACFTLGDALYTFFMIFLFVSFVKKTQAKPLKYTSRVKRLIAAELVLATAFGASFFITVLYTGSLSWGGFFYPQLIRFLPGMLCPLFVFLCYLITWPLEEAVKRWYYNDAKRKLRENASLIKIGVTGSYGKTGMKYALGRMLEKKYSTLITPGSFNTPMGVTRVVREKLEHEHEVFVCEMGARYVGDIAELCRLVSPKYGIITSIGKQHLETFKTEENIIKAKSELMRALPKDGACFLNGDDANCRRVYGECELEEKFLYGTEGEGLYMRALDMAAGASGSEFTLKCGEETVRCHTKLLGKYNILNFAGAAAMAHYLGVSMEMIAEAIAEAEPVEHRLQLIEGTVTVIDDAYNANPMGASEALNVLASFPGKKLIVTPGLVELGEREAEENRAFGERIAKCADVAIIVGKAHADPICEGVLAGGMDADKLVRAENLAAATALLPKYTEPGCVVLFENDLPDNYE